MDVWRIGWSMNSSLWCFKNSYTKIVGDALTFTIYRLESRTHAWAHPYISKARTELRKRGPNLDWAEVCLQQIILRTLLVQFNSILVWPNPQVPQPMPIPTISLSMLLPQSNPLQYSHHWEDYYEYCTITMVLF